MLTSDSPTLFDRQFPLDILDTNRGLFTDEFCEWIVEHIHIFSAFATQAKYVKGVMRRDHYSSRTIGEWLRHNSALREKGDGWKLNNDMFPDLARLCMLAYPELNGLFETRGREFVK